MVPLSFGRVLALAGVLAAPVTAQQPDCAGRMTTDYVTDLLFLSDWTGDVEACRMRCREVADRDIGVMKDARHYAPPLKVVSYACLFDGAQVDRYEYPDGYQRAE